MKNSEVLFLAIGGLEASRLEQSELAPRKRARPRLLLTAALIALTLLLVGCAAAIYSRIHIHYTQYEAPTATVSQTEDSSEKNVLTDCYPQAVCEGYTMTGGAPMDRTTQNLRYSNDVGKTISYSISTSHAIDGALAQPSETSTLTVSGWEATRQVSGYGEGGQIITWHNETDGYYASLFTDDVTADIQAMAESVSFGPRLPLSFLCKQGTPWDNWYPQQIPEGYNISRVSTADSLTVDYSNGDYNITYCASFTRDFMEELGAPPHDSYVWTDETVAGEPGRMMTTSGGLRILYWTNTQEGFHAMLSTPDEAVDILAMAASVAPGAPLELSNDYLGTDYSIELQQEPDTYIGWESIYPQAVPEGYSIDFVSNRAYGEQTVHYKNAAGDSISYTFYYRLGQWGRVFDGMGIPQEVDINGSTGYLNGNQLIWADEAKGYGYALRASEEVDLISIAKSVGIGPELESSDAPNTAKALEELGDYNITALPAGMAEDSFTGSPLEDGGGWYAYVRRWYYNKETNQELYFTYETYVTDADSLEAVAQIAMGDTPAEMRTVHGCTGAAAIRGNQAKVVWIEGTAEKGISFALSSPDYSIEELLAIAESVQKQ